MNVYTKIYTEIDIKKKSVPKIMIWGYNETKEWNDISLVYLNTLGKFQNDQNVS